MEIRNSQPVRLEKRDEGPGVLVGYAGVYFDPEDSSTEFEHPGGFTERFVKGAFEGIEERDVTAGYNHSLDRTILGRTPDTLRLSVDSRGLRYEIDLPPTQSGQEIATAVERGDIRGSSLEFMPKEGGSKRYQDGDRSIREIRAADIFQVGPVDRPAYKGTSVIMRSEEALEAEEWKAEQAKKRAEAEKRKRILATVDRGLRIS